MKRLLLPLFLLVAGSLGVLAAPAPIPADAIGNYRWVDLQGRPNPIGDGGRFVGFVQETNPVGTGFKYETYFWCVDSQLTTGVNDNSYANLHLLSQLPSAQARYGNDPTWTNNSGFLAGITESQDRFAMAAWLIGNYNYAGDAHDLNIQKAIWAIIHNNTQGGGHSAISGDANTFGTIAYWVKQAADNFSSVDLTKWAVVSWTAASNGNLSSGKQTFLVQVVPEPGFYAALALGLFGVFFYTWRRRQSVDGIQTSA